LTAVRDSPYPGGHLVCSKVWRLRLAIIRGTNFPHAAKQSRTPGYQLAMTVFTERCEPIMNSLSRVIFVLVLTLAVTCCGLTSRGEEPPDVRVSNVRRV